MNYSWEYLEGLSNDIKYEQRNMNGKAIEVGYLKNDCTDWIQDEDMRDYFFEKLIEIERFVQKIAYEIMYYQAIGKIINKKQLITITELMDEKNQGVNIEEKIIEDNLKFFFKKFVRDFSYKPLSSLIQYVWKFKISNDQWLKEKVENLSTHSKGEITRKDFNFFVGFRNKLAHPRHIDLGEETSFWNFTKYKLKDYCEIIMKLHNNLRIISHTHPIVN